jgi:hypothetical protein
MGGLDLLRQHPDVAEFDAELLVAGETATARDGRYRPEHLTELRLSLRMWDASQEAVAELDGVIAAPLRSMRRRGERPPRP